MTDPDDSPIQKAADGDVPAALKKVHRQLQRWRSQRTGREPIPSALWAAAGELARQHGVNQVSRALHLEFNQLKRAAEAARGNGRKRTRPAFVELIAPPPPGRECVLELEGRRGKLRIELNGMAAAEIAGISRMLWEMIS